MTNGPDPKKPDEPKSSDTSGAKSSDTSAPTGDEALEALERQFHAREQTMRDGPERAADGNAHADGHAGAEGNAHGQADAGAASEADLDGDAGVAGDADDPDAIDRVALRSTHLGRRLARRRGYAIEARQRKPRKLFGNWSLLILSLVGAWGLASVWPEFSYWISSGPPRDLGRMGAYQIESVPDGSYVKVQGVASPKRGSWSRLFTDHEVFPLIASRILVDRRQAPDPGLKGYGFIYQGEGRLSIVEVDGRWAGVREQFAQAGEVSKDGPLVVIEDGLVPRKGARVPAEVALWLALVLVPLAVLVRRHRAPAP
ncbi:MAG: hypothetical protein JST92_25570 [Deltaproteobacteria bacterium]|nr:hypothetical protein [Deltaproteobacteria bacterium]